MGTRIGIIGSGIVGQTLANGFIAHGFDVMIGTNDEGKHETLQTKTNGRAKIGTFAETAAFGDLLVVATKGSAAEAALMKAGLPHFFGKIVIDTTNPIANDPPVNGVLQYFTPQNSSLMEQLQRLVPQAHFVKAFSCIGNAFMVNPDFGGVKPTMFICGNSAEAKKVVTQILEKFGHDVADMGAVEGARAIEPLCILWCIPGFLNNTWSHAFKLLKK